MKRGFFGIGTENAKTASNVGTLWRSAYIFGASFIYTIGRRIPKQASDTIKAWRHVPYYQYENFDHFYSSMPKDCLLIGIELDDNSQDIKSFKHPERCIYLLGAEDNGLTKETRQRCHRLVQLPGDYCLNVAVAGSIMMFDRVQKDD